MDYFRGHSIGVYQNLYLPAFYTDSKINLFQISIKSGQIKIWTNPYATTSETVYTRDKIVTYKKRVPGRSFSN